MLKFIYISDGAIQLDQGNFTDSDLRMIALKKYAIFLAIIELDYNSWWLQKIDNLFAD